MGREIPTLEKGNPKLCKEWDHKKNNDSPADHNISSHHKAWWICNKKHSYDAQIRHRHNGSKCPICAGRRADKNNNLKKEFPKVAKRWDYSRNDDLPENVVSGSHSKRYWLCENNHSYESVIRTQVNGHQCPYCMKKLASKEYNLKVIRPTVAKYWDSSKNKIPPTHVLPFSKKQAFWRCNKNHTWKDTPFGFSKINESCPFCSGVRINKDNNLKALYPELIKTQWDFKKNKSNPERIKPGSNTKYWWVCKIHNHSWRADPYSRAILGYKCVYCVGQKPSHTNNLKIDNPKLAKEWNYKKNNSKPEDYTAASIAEVWWICNKGHEWVQKIHSRTYGKKCPFCSKSRPSENHNLAFYFPDIAKQWDLTTNKGTPSDYLPQSRYLAWWICSVGHKWQQTIVNRTPSLTGLKPGTGCPYCSITPRSKEEIYLLFELKQFFNINEDDHKIKLKKIVDVDIKFNDEKVIIEYDGSYWHKDKAERDKEKTKSLENAGWTVIRIREKPLKILSQKFNISSKPMDYKNTANKTLKKLNSLGFQVTGLEKYLNRKTLINKKNADEYILKLLKQKKRHTKDTQIF